MRRKKKQLTTAISLSLFLLNLSILATTTEAANPTFNTEEDLAYNEFILPYYPDGLRAAWNGVYANYLDWHANDSEAVWINKNHEISTESTSLLAHYAALRGDQATFDQMYDLWSSEAYFLSQKFQVEHWILDQWGTKYSTDGNYANAPGEEVRMIEALKIASDKFTPTGGRDYAQLAKMLADGLKGINGGQGNFEPLNTEADGYLLRPWFIWSPYGEPLSLPGDPVRIPLNYNNFVSYYYAADWLGDPFYHNVINYTLDIVKKSQNTNTASAGKGLFKTFYDIGTRQYSGENNTNTCSTLSNFDIAMRLGAYGYLVNDQQTVDTGRLFFDFIKAKYINDGIIWASYDYESGEPVDQYSGLTLYSFFAQLAMEYRDYDLAEKIIREQILPFQVKDPSDAGYYEGYYGAFKSVAGKYESEQDIWKDASAFINLETIKALHKWNSTDKGSWQSSYPMDWTTVASVVGGNGGEDIIEFNTVNARYLKILCKEHSLPAYGYSIFTLEVFGPDMAELASNKKISVSSTQGPLYIGPKAVDNDNTTRWSSEFKTSPQWVYVDLGENKNINKVRILWEAAYATDYEIQAGQIKQPITDVVSISKAIWSSKAKKLTVEAISSSAPAAKLTAVRFGPMVYNSSTGKYTGTYRNVRSNPGTVTVTSDLGGSTAAIVVTVK